MLEGKAREGCMYLDLVQPWFVLPHPQNYCLVLPRQSVFLHLSSLGGRDDLCKDPISLCHLKVQYS